jgi:tetratricopeptide (TPR) repeat protein
VQGRFHNLPVRETAQGLIFYDEDRAKNVRAGHPVIAGVASLFYEALRNPATVLQEIVIKAESSSDVERRFVTRLLLRQARAKSLVLSSSLPQIEMAIVQCQERATINELVSGWRTFYRALGKHGHAERCVTDALTRLPTGSADCVMLLKLHREHGKEAEALPILTKWIRLHTDDSSVRTTYLGLVERTGNAEQVKQVLQETSAWLALHTDDSSVRTNYLGLVERKGNAEQVKQVLQETSAWLALHPENTDVRKRYLGLVERKGNAEQVKQVLQETSMWLALHTDDSQVRTNYLGLVERKGTPEQVEHVLQDISAWLGQHSSAKEVWGALIALLVRSARTEEAAETALKAISYHPHDASLTSHYLRFVNDSEDEQVVRKLYKRLIDSYPRDSRVSVHFAAWLRNHNHPNEARALYESLVHGFPRSFQVRHGYGCLLLSLGEFQQAVEQFRQALKIHKGHQMAHEGLAQSWRGLGALAEKEGKHDEADQHFMRAEQEFSRALYWADFQAKPQAQILHQSRLVLY